MDKEKFIRYLNDLINLTWRGERVSVIEGNHEEAKAYDNRREAYKTVKNAVESGVYDTDLD